MTITATTNSSGPAQEYATMLDEQTIQKIATRFARALGAVLAELDDPPADEHLSRISGGIIRHLIHAELGREPDHREVDAVYEAVQGVLSGGDQDGDTA